METTTSPYPLRLTGELSPRLSRWLWLVKWLLAIPHFLVLVFLWIGFVVSTAVAGFSILFTGRYPRRIFDFNVGVLRWSWRVGFYSYSALGTDRYPPFTLADVPDYPARLEVHYPRSLSCGLVLAKWWLLALPRQASHDPRSEHRHLCPSCPVPVLPRCASGPARHTGAVWMAHCHIAEHHERAMMFSFDVTP